MTDCYRILGVSPRASQDEIRAAYIGKMKVVHPDAARERGEAPAGASEITSAYWQLRDPDRRLEHDRRIFASTSLAKPDRRPIEPRRRLIPALKPRRPQSRRREQASRMFMGAGIGILVIALAAPAGLFWLAHLNPIEPARASVAAEPAAAERIRRPVDGAMRAAAADDFASVVRDFGLDGARTYSHRCLEELSRRASLSMLDYCIAFDDAAANWERPKVAAADKAALFDDAQRSGAYREAARSVQEPSVRSAMLQEASFFGGTDYTAPADVYAAELSVL